ncbi:MAG TPA: hypothetical protein VGW36_09565, partial [Pyrinomonadaceae bacterium]|nr:hypothetical protein [Pyrinomonadaceae bacterium]
NERILRLLSAIQGLSVHENPRVWVKFLNKTAAGQWSVVRRQLSISIVDAQFSKFARQRANTPTTDY